MGWPALIALAASAVGTGMQAAASAQEGRRMENAAQAEVERQKRFREEGARTFAQSLSQSGSEPAARQIAEGAQRTAGAYQAAQAVPLSSSAQEGKPVSRLEGDSATQLETQRSNEARAQLGGYTDWQLGQMVRDLQAQNALQVIAGNAAYSQNVLPLELQQAGRSAEGLRGAGSLVSSLGNMGAMASAYKAPKPRTVGSTYGGTWNTGRSWF